MAGAPKKQKILSEKAIHRKREYNRLKAHTRVLLGPIFTRWRELRDVEGFLTDAALALFLMDYYQKKSSTCHTRPLQPKKLYLTDDSDHDWIKSREGLNMVLIMPPEKSIEGLHVGRQKKGNLDDNIEMIERGVTSPVLADDINIKTLNDMDEAHIKDGIKTELCSEIAIPTLPSSDHTYHKEWEPIERSQDGQQKEGHLDIKIVRIEGGVTSPVLADDINIKTVNDMDEAHIKDEIKTEPCSKIAIPTLPSSDHTYNKEEEPIEQSQDGQQKEGHLDIKIVRIEGGVTSPVLTNDINIKTINDMDEAHINDEIKTEPCSEIAIATLPSYDHSYQNQSSTCHTQTLQPNNSSFTEESDHVWVKPREGLNIMENGSGAAKLNLCPIVLIMPLEKSLERLHVGRLKEGNLDDNIEMTEGGVTSPVLADDTNIKTVNDMDEAHIKDEIMTKPRSKIAIPRLSSSDHTYHKKSPTCHTQPPQPKKLCLREDSDHVWVKPRESLNMLEKGSGAAKLNLCPIVLIMPLEKSLERLHVERLKEGNLDVKIQMIEGGVTSPVLTYDKNIQTVNYMDEAHIKEEIKTEPCSEIAIATLPTFDHTYHKEEESIERPNDGWLKEENIEIKIEMTEVPLLQC